MFHQASAMRCHARRSIVRVQAGRESGTVRKTILPIFPLSLVPLPAAIVPLMIFEARQVAMHACTHDSECMGFALL